jgi:hypothetical protein
MGTDKIVKKKRCECCKSSVQETSRNYKGFSMTDESDVRRTITPEREAKLYRSFDQAWADVQQDRHRYPIWARTRAGMMFERLAIRLQENFAGDPGVRFVFATETVKVIFDEKLMIRCKKADGQGLGHNIPTGANDMFCEQGAFPGFEPLEKVEVVYVLNAYSTAIKRIMVQARDGDVRLWAYEIDDTALPAAAPIAPFPTPSAPSPDISMLVQPRTQPVSKDETDKK